MKLRHLAAGACALLLSGAVFGQTVANFDGGADTPVTLQTFGAPGGPGIQAAGGNPGGFLQLTPNVNGQHNWATFDRTSAGAFARSDFSFNFRLDNFGGGGADGFSISYLPTSTAGTTGGLVAPLFTAEDPAAAGVLGIGFDTWGNGDIFDTNANGPDYSQVKLFYNGGLIVRIDDTRVLPQQLNLKDGLWHTVSGSVDFAAGQVSLLVDANPIFNNVSVPGLAPFESRVGLAARTGGANERASIDNVAVRFVPAPARAVSLAAAGLLLLTRRRPCGARRAAAGPGYVPCP